MPRSPFHLTALTTLLALVAAATIVTGAPVGEGAAAKSQASMVPSVQAAMLPVVQDAAA